MYSLICGIFARIFSNSFINVYQKVLTQNGANSSVINLYTYLGLTIICTIFIPQINISFTNTLLLNFLFMGILGALGNYFIIKALSLGELSSLAPLNSFKPIAALVIAFFYLGEVPAPFAVLGILLIIIGTFILQKISNSNRLAILYRLLALLFSGMEAVFIKKIVILTNVQASFLLWALSGLIFSFIFFIFSGHKLKITSFKYQFILICLVAIMQYSTNFVFSKMNVAYALALFQLSAIISIFLGAKFFDERHIKRKIIASAIMIFGAIIIILG